MIVPMIGFGQDNKQKEYVEIAQINAPKVDKYTWIGEVLFTQDMKYFILKNGINPTYLSIYELSTQKYINSYKIPGFPNVYYINNTFYTSNGKRRNLMLSLESGNTTKVKNDFFYSIVNTDKHSCYFIDIDSEIEGVQCGFIDVYAFCWEYLGKVLTIKKRGCVLGDCVNGQGTYNFQNGDKYVGEWKDNMMNGLGTYTWANGAKYEGEYKNDMKNGLGTWANTAGHKYVGEWKDNKQNGQGTYTLPSGEKYVGEWKNDMKNGLGTYTFVDGEKYEGEYKNDMENGLGTWTHPEGDKYVGEFKDGKFNGEGTYTFPSGTIKKGIFENGEFIEE